MPNFQTIVLDTATPQLRAPGTGDGYSFDSGATNLGTWTTTGLTLSTGSLTLTPGTANGVLYLNGSKVATSGSALTFDGTRFGVGTSSAVWNSGERIVASQSANAPAFTGYVTFGGGTPILVSWNNAASGSREHIWFADSAGGSVRGKIATDGANGMQFLYGSTEGMRLTSTGLLIGNTSGYGVGSAENNSLQAKGPIVLAANNTGSASNRNWVMQTNAAAAGSFSLAYSSTNTGWPNAAYAMVIDSSGNLGIGTSSPSNGAKLDAAGAIISTAATLSSFNANNAGFDFIAASKVGRFFATSTDTTGGVMTFTTGQNGSYSERARIDSSGNLGLGVTPSANAAWINFQTQRAVISGGANDRNESSFNSYRTSGQYTYIGNGVATMYQQISGQHIWYQAASGTAGNAITFTQAMTLDASGNLGIGTTSPGALLDVYSATTSNYVRVGSASTFSAGLSIAANANTHLTSGSLVYQDSSNRLNLLNYANAALRLGTNNTFRVSVPAAGGIVVGTAALATNATDGFLYVPTCAGAPTGTPTAQTGTAPIVIDTTNNKLYFYSGGVWRDAGP